MIKKLPKHKSVKLSSTVAGQREQIREITNKVNELVEGVNDCRETMKKKII